MSKGGCIAPSYRVADAENKPTANLLDRGSNKLGEWVYGQANGAISQYSVVKIDNDGQLSQLTTAISGDEPTRVGIAQVALADNEYGWVWVGCGGGSGSGIKVTALANCAVDVKLYTTTTAGSIDDTATDLIVGLTIVTAPGGSAAAVECYAPTYLYTN